MHEWHNGCVPALQAGEASSTLVSCSNAGVAQLAVQLICNQQVVSSSLTTSSNPLNSALGEESVYLVRQLEKRGVG